MPPRLGRYLEWHHGKVRVTLSVPKHLQATVGSTKLKRLLDTDSPARAEVLKGQVLRELQARIAAAVKGHGDPLAAEALSWKETLSNARSPEGPDDPYDDVGTFQMLLSERAEELARQHGPSVASTFVGIATGTETPLKQHLETFLAEKPYSPRYKDDIRRAVGRLSEWCVAAQLATSVESIARKTAGQFVSGFLAQRLRDHKTINKDISALSSYWVWMGRRGHLSGDQDNPWRGQNFEVRREGGPGAEGKERAFTDEEAARLLSGPAPQRLQDVMWIAALSGMRIDEVCRLQARDCQDGWFSVNARRGQTGEGKTDAAQRKVPIHPALCVRVERLCKGQKPEDLIIQGLPDADPKGIRKPSAAVGQEFVRYRRKLKVDERSEGKRRARVNFHSWRRWFVVSALQAGAPPHIVSAVVGHKDGRKGVTLTTYDTRGPSAAQAIAAVGAVKVPRPKPSN